MKIKVIGIGGAGSIIVNELYLTGLKDVETMIVNTDKTAWGRISVPKKIEIGSDHRSKELFLQSFDDSLVDLELEMDEADLNILVTGLGGSTGSAVTSVLAVKARKKINKTVAFVTMPAAFETSLKHNGFSNKVIAILEKTIPTCVVDLKALGNDPNFAEIANKLSLDKYFHGIDVLIAGMVKDYIENEVQVKGKTDISPCKDAESILDRAVKIFNSLQILRK